MEVGYVVFFYTEDILSEKHCLRADIKRAELLPNYD